MHSAEQPPWLGQGWGNPVPRERVNRAPRSFSLDTFGGGHVLNKNNINMPTLVKKRLLVTWPTVPALQRLKINQFYVNNISKMLLIVRILELN